MSAHTPAASLSAPQQPPPPPQPTLQIPEWDAHAAKPETQPPPYISSGAGGASASGASRGGVAAKWFNAVFSPQRTYFGLRRKWFVVLVASVALAGVALVVGLSVGLTVGRHHGTALPLPTNSASHTGDLTYYAPGLGACGLTSSSHDLIVAISHLVFDAAQTGTDPNANPLCGRKVRARRYDDAVGGWRSVDLRVVDRCVGCAATDLDTSTTAFDRLASRSQGRVDVTWAWL